MPLNLCNLPRLAANVLLILLLTACNGGGSAGPLTVGGSVDGLLSGRSAVLQDNGGDSMTVTTNATFTFPTPVASGLPYKVTVLTQPIGEQCSIIGGSGTAGAAAINVRVTCIPLPNVWSWIGGSKLVNAPGVYGTLGIAAAGNVPSARYGAISWQDSSGNVWLFGGQGDDSAGNQGFLNDLWEYSAGQWKWVSGSNTINASGSYGTQHVAAAGNVPGARFAAINWLDASGNVWMFGGQGYDAAGNQGALNDLWEYSAGQWRWVSGANTISATGVYGTKGTRAPGNEPGARYAANSWIDASGNFWFFGGLGFDSAGNQGFLNDLWEYSAGQWNWVSGANTANVGGTYGMAGTAAAGNAPGARLRSISWIDSSGNLWFFGGLGYDSTGNQGALNDLWEYSAGQWKWVGGANTIAASGSYGTKGTAAAGNVPGARYAANAWTDSSGNVWLFGGVGYDSAGAQGGLNDLWEYSAGQWKWKSGADTINSSGSFGTLGVSAPGSVPSARYAAISWIDVSGSLWLLGGLGYDSAGTQGVLNDLWAYTP